ncbi:MAG: pilus assembly protein PilP [Oceanococcaceae bacterium]
MSRTKRRVVARGLLGGMTVLLSACAADNSDLQNYIDQVKARTSTVVEPMPQVLVYEPFRYTQSDARDPFRPLARILPDAANAPSSSNDLAPDFSRNRETLEFFPLEALRMRGTLNFSGNLFAVIESPDGLVHRVQTGNHMGQNFGQITAIRDAEIVLEEIVPNGLGGYVKREAKVALSGDDE